MSPELTAAEPQSEAQRSARTTGVSTRCLDLVGAGTGLIFLSPLLLVIAVAIRLSGHGPAIFRSTRIGQCGRPFTLYKFRSMIEGAQILGPVITSSEDPRITPLGRRLRRSKLDELPQLINVVKGEMSLVGPRPEAPEYVALYSREQLGILRVRPGMTSPASLRYRDEETELTGDDWQNHYIQQVMPAKLAIDSEYCRTRTVWTDIKVVIDTLVGLGKSKNEV